MENKIYHILNEMSEVLTIQQMRVLQTTLIKYMSGEDTLTEQQIPNTDYLDMFIAAKRIEGCSERTIEYYRTTIVHMLNKMNIPIRQITTEDLREYLTQYQQNSQCGKVTIDNIRRNLSSFFSWLEAEDHILKSPIRRIHKVRTGTKVKETFTDENIEDINFEERECVVYGKGNKERTVYFDARTKIHLQEYIKKRKDNNPALFVRLDKPYERLQISGVEIRLRKLGRELNIEKVHPHKFRRSMATKAIDKGMPIEQVQRLLGHQQIDTTMHYAMVSQNNVRNSHRKYIA